jgi:serine/threonine protein kinase
MNKLPNKKFSMKSTLMIISQCLERLKEMHDLGIIHRDMKPENLVIGNKGKENYIYLIDFGLSKNISGDKKQTIQKEKIVIGTVRYISLNTHLGNQQYKKDDLESLVYMMVYFIRGELPWQNIKAKSRKEKYTKIYNMKKNSIKGELFEFFPEEIITFAKYILNLSNYQKPDYLKLNNIINGLMKKYGYNYDFQFDWYNSSFLNNLYNPSFKDEDEDLKSSSIFEEEIQEEEKDIFKQSLKNSGKKKNKKISKKFGNNYNQNFSVKTIKHINTNKLFLSKGKDNVNKNINYKIDINNNSFNNNITFRTKRSPSF